MRKHKITFLLPGIFCIMLTAITLHAQEKATPRPAVNKWVRYYFDRIEIFQKENASLKDSKWKNIVLLGDSLTEGFDAQKYLPGRHFVNRGIVSDHVGTGERGILRRLDSSVFDCNPSHVFFMIGVNDLGDDITTGSIRRIAACYREVCATIIKKAPDVKLYILSCLPTAKKYARLNPPIMNLNSHIKEIAGEMHLTYIDLHSLMKDERGELRQEYTREGLHLTPAAYLVWARAIEPFLPPAGDEHP
ncbi:MAG: GDSL-type esterase/lipase family protein [Candidatus Sumerlaeota bacterium]|nr:GDSL-type esterase/lipase family protein [Candidatus Sumerlaeota bacterium]